MFKDESSFIDWYEFETPTGRIRAEICGNNQYKIFVDQGDAFLFDAIVSCRGKNPKSIYNAYINQSS